MNAFEAIQNITFGTELEYTGITREKAAKAIQQAIGGTINHAGGGYDAWTVTAPDGKVWKAISDASIGYLGSEIVTPVLTYRDINNLQIVVRNLRKAGAKATRATSQHVHIGVDSFSAEQIANIVRIFYKQEELILKAVGTWEHRLERYTQRTEHSFIERLETIKPKTRTDLNRAWFGRNIPNPSHYDSSRYHALNLNNVWRTGTVEFRCFNGTTHAGEVKANIILCLAIAAKALKAKSASSKKQRVYSDESAKYDTRVFLLHLGLIGDEFKNTRDHLLKFLPGSSAWKNGRRIA